MSHYWGIEAMYEWKLNCEGLFLPVKDNPSLCSYTFQCKTGKFKKKMFTVKQKVWKEGRWKRTEWNEWTERQGEDLD